jgi:hypothetical protein
MALASYTNSEGKKNMTEVADVFMKNIAMLNTFFDCDTATFGECER